MIRNSEEVAMPKIFQDVFPKPFLDNLNEVALQNEVRNLKIGEQEINDYIDIEQLLSDMGFDVKMEPLFGNSGRIHDKEIIINEDDASTRKRFSMAHELGHAYRQNREAARHNGTIGYTPDQLEEEVFANKFAAQLLMPRVLMVQYTEEIIQENQLDGENLEKQAVDEIIEHLASRLNVSLQSMKFRVENVRLFSAS
jgi:Zn-dependent peptidase ImmA (M78 family)